MIHQIEITQPGRVTVYYVKAYNRPTAVHEVNRFRKLDVPWELGDYSEYNDHLRQTWEDSFGIVNWASYEVESGS